MIKKVKIILFPNEHKSKNGAFFEDLIRSIFDKQGYEIDQNINFTGLEIDIYGKHKIRNEKLIIECKAKQKPKSTEIKNFLYNVLIGKKGDFGYFFYTEKLDHQATALKDENLENPEVNKKVAFMGPSKIIELLVDANKIKTLDISQIPNKENIDEIILAYTYFGVFYIIIPYSGSKKEQYYVINAISGKQIADIQKIANLNYSKTITIESALKSEISEISKLQFRNSENKEKNNSIPIIEKFICDYPLGIDEWVGRKQELKNISSNNFNTIFITGIGGQGKSALASYYIQNIVDSKWEFWDWRDLKEEENRLHTKIISIIERLTNGIIKPNNIKDETLETLLDLFFRHLEQRKIVFVFDNVDKYIDLEDFLPTGGLKKLYYYIKTRPHSSKFIFTCRPLIMLADLNLYQIRLQGLHEIDTIELFQKSKIGIKKDELIEIAKEIHKLTKGHPHWIKIFIGQAYSGKGALLEFIKTVKNKTTFKEDSLSAIFSKNILDTIWDTLNENQKTLLRTFSETVKAETENNLGKIMTSEINFNRFHKALRRLRRLNLIVAKTLKNEEDQLELHPLVKEFMLQKYPLHAERSKFITLFVNFYDNAICVLRKRLNWQMKFTDFEQWSSKIELEINNHDYKSALVTLQEVSDPLLTAGYLTEFIRVSELLFSIINWETAIHEEFSYFHGLLKSYIYTLIEQGKTVIATDYLIKYSKTIQGKGENYITYCEMNCYYYWFNGDHENAIQWGEKIIKLKKEENNSGIINTLALAWRDSKKETNVNKALDYFLENEPLDNVIDSKNINNELGGPFYGNIGRCLYFKADYDNSLSCYQKSLKLLTKEKASNTDLNKGYACLWIAETYINKNDNKNALYFLKNAFNAWKKVSPPKANKIEEKINKLLEIDKSLQVVNELKNDEIEIYCIKWIDK